MLVIQMKEKRKRVEKQMLLQQPQHPLQLQQLQKVSQLNSIQTQLLLPNQLVLVLLSRNQL